MSSLFKRAAVRGVAHQLVARGVCEFPSKEAMDEAADAVADAPVAAGMPEVSPAEGHSPEQLEEVARKLIEIAQALMAEAHSGAPGMEGPAGAGGPPPDVKAAAEQVKQAELRDFNTVVSEAAVACMDKAAAEAKLASDPKLVGVGKSEKNDLATAASTDSTAELDKKHRPDGKYLAGRGQTGLETKPGEIGHSAAPTVAPSKSPSGSNSVTEGTKGAALREIIQKHANKLVGLHEAKPNNLANSPDSLAKLDSKNRPEGKYVVGQGNANIKTPASAHIGVETKPTAAPSQSPGGSNSVTEASKAASEEALLACADDVGPYLPAAMSDEAKVAAIIEMAPLDTAGRQTKISALHAEHTQKTSSLLDRVREIAAKAK